MSHIAEGLMHAHLDGALRPEESTAWASAEAHMDVCDDCRRRFEEARELRDSASALLTGAAAPSTARPDFGDLLARAEERGAGQETRGEEHDASVAATSVAAGVRPPVRRAGPRPWWRSTAKLAWAASLVLAVGAGWIGRRLLVERNYGTSMVAVERGRNATDVEGRVPEPGAAAGDAAPSAQPQKAGEAETTGQPPESAEPAPTRQPRAAAEPGQEQGIDGDAPVAVPSIRVAPTTVAEDRAEAAGDAAGAGEAAEVAEKPAAPEAVPAGGEIRAHEPAALGQFAAEPGPRPVCYAAVAADAAAGRDERAGAAFAMPRRLRLGADHSADGVAGGSAMIGFWYDAPGDSIRVRLTDGDVRLDMRLRRDGAAVAGGAVAGVVTQTGGDTAQSRSIVLTAAECPTVR